jgi:hypothetical protein
MSPALAFGISIELLIRPVRAGAPERFHYPTYECHFSGYVRHDSLIAVALSVFPIT